MLTRSKRLLVSARVCAAAPATFTFKLPPTNWQSVKLMFPIFAPPLKWFPPLATSGSCVKRSFTWGAVPEVRSSLKRLQLVPEVAKVPGSSWIASRRNFCDLFHSYDSGCHTPSITLGCEKYENER